MVGKNYGRAIYHAYGMDMGCFNCRSKYLFVAFLYPIDINEDRKEIISENIEITLDKVPNDVLYL